jgi:hypothetical protein
LKSDELKGDNLMQQPIQGQSNTSKLQLLLALALLIVVAIVVALLVHHGSQPAYPRVNSILPQISNTQNVVSNSL